MNFRDAKAKAMEHIDNLASDIALKLVEDATIEKEFGWVFFYDSARHLESGSPSDAVAGNTPIIVSQNGDVHVTGTAHALEHYIAEFESHSLQSLSANADPPVGENMGSRRFFYFLPAREVYLDFCKVVRFLEAEGFAFHSPVCVNTLDESGVLLFASEQNIEPPSASVICRLLDAGNNLDVASSNDALMLGCSFGSPHTEPVFSIHVSRKAWLRLKEDTRSKYERVLARVADEAGAQNVVVIDDPADDFLGSIERVDEHWFIDLRLPDGSEYDASLVWVDARKNLLPIMRGLKGTGRRIGSFDEFEEQLS